MKTDNRTTREPGRAVVPPPPTTSPTAAPTTSPADVATLEADLAALAREEEELRRRREDRRAQFWTLSIANLSRAVDQLVNQGFSRADIAKAIGFASPGKGASPATAKKPGGPKTHDGWYTLYLNGEVQSYLKSHPDLASRLKASGVSRHQLPSHIPPQDLLTIQEAARTKAQAKCPQVPVEVSSK
jgi:hypothetical protein